MGIHQTEELLKRFDYTFERRNSELIIKLKYSQRIIADFSESGKVVLKDQLVSWNFLTGILEMSIKNAMLYNFVVVVLFSFVLFFVDVNKHGLNLFVLFLLVMFWILLWSFYYFKNAENCKRTLMRWNEGQEI